MFFAAIGATPLVAFCSVALSVVMMDSANEPPTVPAAGWFTAYVRLPSLLGATVMVLWLAYVDLLFHRARILASRSTVFRNASALLAICISFACAFLMRRGAINWSQAVDQWYRKEEVFRLAYIRPSSALLFAACGTFALFCVVGARLISPHPILRCLGIVSAVIIIYWALAYVVLLASPFAELSR
jgi:hypothetical protein